MHLTLFKKLGIFHRKTKSDSAAILVRAKESANDTIHPSASAPRIQEDAFYDAVFISPFANFHFETNRNSQSDSSQSPLAPLHGARTKQSILDEIAALETANASLRAEKEQKEREMNDLSMQATSLHADYYAERTTAITITRKHKDTRKSLTSSLDKRAQLENVSHRICSLIPMDDPVLFRARTAILNGEDAYTALADSISLGAAVHGSTWAQLFPPIDGTRNTDELMNALCLAAKTRTELEKVTFRRGFWKQQALKDDPPSTITPSSSALSALGFGSTTHRTDLPSQRKLAVEALIQRRRESKEHRLLSLTDSYIRPSHPEPLTPRFDLEAPNDIMPVDVTSHRPLTLPPLASAKFKEELHASHSSERFSLPYLNSKNSGLLSSRSSTHISNHNLHPAQAAGDKAMSDTRIAIPGETPGDQLRGDSQRIPRDPGESTPKILKSGPKASDSYDPLTSDNPETSSSQAFPAFHLPTRKRISWSFTSSKDRRSRLISRTSRRHSHSRPASEMAASSSQAYNHGIVESKSTNPSGYNSQSAVPDGGGRQPKKASRSRSPARIALASLDRLVGTVFGRKGHQFSVSRKHDIPHAVDGSMAVHPGDSSVSGASRLGHSLIQDDGYEDNCLDAHWGSPTPTPSSEFRIAHSASQSAQQDPLVLSQSKAKRSSYRSSLTLASSPGMTEESGTLVQHDSTAQFPLNVSYSNTVNPASIPKINFAKSSATRIPPPSSNRLALRTGENGDSKSARKSESFARPTLSSSLKQSSTPPKRAPLRPRNGSSPTKGMITTDYPRARVDVGRASPKAKASRSVLPIRRVLPATAPLSIQKSNKLDSRACASGDLAQVRRDEKGKSVYLKSNE